MAETPHCDWHDVQGLVLRGYNQLPVGECLILTFADHESIRSWLKQALRYVSRGDDPPSSIACAIALSHAGLLKLSGSADGSALRHFSREFTEGMSGDPHRSRILGDSGPSDPSTWEWGGGHGKVDALVFACAESQERLRELHGQLAPAAGEASAKTITLTDLYGAEHFGFRDGVSQPILETTRLARHRPDSHHVVKLGEMLLGYPDNGGFVASVPAVLDNEAFGRNGSYLVCRQLEQDVAKFDAFVARAAEGTGLDAAAGAAIVRAKMLGRRNDGSPLLPTSANGSTDTDNEFGYFEHDREGRACPIGAHIRRANPRDTLETDSKDRWQAANRHRILRRGRPYGPRWTGHDERPVRRGLLFLGLNADIDRQFEFIQHNWLNDPAFAGLFGETDPVVGDDPAGEGNASPLRYLAEHAPVSGGPAALPQGRALTMPGSPARCRRTDLERFVTTRGGEYFFLPGLRALEFLAGVRAMHDGHRFKEDHAPDSREGPAVDALASTLTAHVREDAEIEAARSAGPVMLRRDAHAKMHGCVQAELEVSDDVPEPLRHGIFARSRTFPAWVRFSNAHGLRHDLEIDPRGMAIKVLGLDAPATERLADEATTQDFLLVTHHSFFVPSPIEFVDFPMALRSGGASLVGFFVKRRLWRGGWALVRSGFVIAESPLTLAYFSQTPYRLGPSIVKLQARPARRADLSTKVRFLLRAVPCNLLMTLGAALGASQRTRDWCARHWDPDGMRHAMAGTLREQKASFDICVQRRTSEAMPVDDPTVPWSQTQSPYQKVATLRIFRQPVAGGEALAGPAAERAAEAMSAVGERLSFSPWHGLKAHEPLGAINRARRKVYHTIAAVRNSANQAKIGDPSTVEFDKIREMVKAGEVGAGPPAALPVG